MNTRLLPALALLLGFTLARPAHADDTRYRDHMRNARYGEIVVVTGGPFRFVGHVYNTLGLNDCPEAAWKALEPKQIARQWHARTVLLNGPRYFVMDRASLANPGPVTTFGGIQARHFANVDISLFSILKGRAKAYTENVVKRTSDFVYDKGKPVYELIAPDGREYVMQTYALLVDPKLTMADLPTLGKRLHLPKGWHYRVRTLDRDLSLKAHGTAYVLQDELENSYQRVTAP
jgi:hypothetical protein